MASRLMRMAEPFKFQSLELYRKALDYLDEVADVSEKLPKKAAVGNTLLESATHLVVQIAGKSSGESEIERAFLVDGTLMSLMETVACLDIIGRRKLLPERALERAYGKCVELHEHLQKMKRALKRR